MRDRVAYTYTYIWQSMKKESTRYICYSMTYTYMTDKGILWLRAGEREYTYTYGMVWKVLGRDRGRGRRGKGNQRRE